MSEAEVPKVESSEGVSRRRVLKTLVAAGSAAAATAVVPGTWQKPVAQIGALPAHAQVSQTPPVLTNVVIRRALDAARPIAIATHEVTFDFTDLLAGVTKNALVTAELGATTAPAGQPVAACSGDPIPAPGLSLQALGATGSYTPSAGTITVPFSISCSVASFELCVTLEAGGRTSEPACGFWPTPSVAP